MFRVSVATNNKNTFNDHICKLCEVTLQFSLLTYHSELVHFVYRYYFTSSLDITSLRPSLLLHFVPQYYFTSSLVITSLRPSLLLHFVPRYYFTSSLVITSLHMLTS